ncbi:hypothetical protein [Hymenobacter koreensis]|uniref:hypothetical protein n=1 Tax=Hymenobacter koreensis TaxID=1084523 RepID=UPI0031EA72FD
METGRKQDPLGQYWRKGAVRGNKANPPATWPKIDARQRRMWLVREPSGDLIYTTSGPTDDLDCGDLPCPGGGGYQPPVPATVSAFRTSEGQASFSGPGNPQGDILDLKIVKGSSANLTALPGYTIIPVDLNKGAGGQYIYLTFTRDPTKVQYGDEVKKDQVNTDGFAVGSGRYVIGPVRAIYSKSARSGADFQNWPRFSVPNWAPSPTNFDDWIQPDLNDGSGGRFIASYQGKDHRYSGRPIEVGVIAGNSPNITPPAGWVKVDGVQAPEGVDRNEGAGGDYIYFVLKSR